MSLGLLVRMGVLTLVCALNLAAPLQAQTLRDPTQPPPEVMQPATQDGGSGPASPFAEDGVAVIVRDGKSYLAHGTRLYAVGQKVGDFLVERITETEVWLRKDGDLRKLALFDSIERKSATGAISCTSAASQPSSSNHSNSAQAASCAGNTP